MFLFVPRCNYATQGFDFMAYYKPVKQTDMEQLKI